VNPPRQPHRGVVESVIYPGYGNPQNRHNNMLRGPVHVNSPLPSEQFAPQATDPRVNDFRVLQSQTKPAPNVPAHQHQQVFNPADQSQMPPQAGTPTHMQGWLARNNEAAVHNGVQNPPSQPANVLDMASLTGPFKLPPGTSLLFRNTPGNTNGKVLHRYNFAFAQCDSQVMPNYLQTRPPCQLVRCLIWIALRFKSQFRALRQPPLKQAIIPDQALHLHEQSHTQHPTLPRLSSMQQISSWCIVHRPIRTHPRTLTRCPPRTPACRSLLREVQLRLQAPL